MTDLIDDLDLMTPAERHEAFLAFAERMEREGKRIDVRLKAQHYCAIMGALTVCLDMFGDELTPHSLAEIRDAMAELRIQLRWNFTPDRKN